MIGVTFALVHEGRKGFKRYSEESCLTALFQSYCCLQVLVWFWLVCPGFPMVHIPFGIWFLI